MCGGALLLELCKDRCVLHDVCKQNCPTLTRDDNVCFLAC